MRSNVAIVGAGPGGMATALQLKRFGEDFLLFEGEEVGGLLRNAWRVENYLGFSGISGRALVRAFKEHIEHYGVDIIMEWVSMLDYRQDEDDFILLTRNGEYFADVVVIASGTKPRSLNIVNNLPSHLRDKVYYGICPLLNLEGKRILVIGAGDAGFDYAMSLAEKNEVIVVNRGREIKALKALRDKVLHHPRIRYVQGLELIGIEEGGLGLCVDFGREVFDVHCLVLAIGRVPNKDFYSERLMDMERDLVNREKLFLVGDVRGGGYRQCAMAVGDGIRCAMQIHYGRMG